MNLAVEQGGGAPRRGLRHSREKQPYDPSMPASGQESAMAEEVTGEMIDALNLFVEEVQALVGSEFVKRLNGERETVRVKWADPSSPAPGGPVGDPRALHAASRILRFLEDRGEPPCLVNMDALFQRLPLSPALASRFQDIRLQTEYCLTTLAVDAPVLLNGQTLKRR